MDEQVSWQDAIKHAASALASAERRLGFGGSAGDAAVVAIGWTVLATEIRNVHK